MDTCYMCNAEIEHSTAYGPDGDLCQSCWLMLCEESQSQYDSWYGMAPHEHIPFDDGRLRGHITRLIDYSDRPQQDGWYEIEPGLWFSPDPEVDGGMGVWEERREAGR